MMKQKPAFRICPECKSKEIEWSVTCQRFMVYHEDINSSTRTVTTDAGYTQCLKCGHREDM